MSHSIDETGFAVFRQYYDELMGFLTVKLGSRHNASDIVQETFARILALKAPDKVRQPRAFLYKTALNLTVDAFRRERVQAERAVDWEVAAELPAQTCDQETIVASRERLRILSRAIAELPPKCRHVFLLHKFEHRSHAEIAERLGISKNMVEKHVIKALAHCRQQLEETSGMDDTKDARSGEKIRPSVKIWGQVPPS